MPREGKEEGKGLGRGRGRRREGEKEGEGGREEKETYIHRHHQMGCLFPRDTTAAIVHKKQHKLTFH